MPSSGARTRLSALLRLAAPAVGDHGAFAAAQLALHVLLARWLSPTEYGAFVVAHALFLVSMAVHAAFLAEPVLVLTRREFAGRERDYFGTLLGLHGALSVGLGLLLGVALLGLHGLGHHSLCVPGAALAASTPVLLLLSLLRRFGYASLAPAEAARGTLVYAMLLVAGLVALRAADAVSTVSAIGVMGLASLAGALRIGRRIALARPPRPAGFGREVARHHWHYGRWALPSTLLAWLPWNLHFALLALVWPLEDVAALRALYNVILPITHLLMAVSAIALPLLARQTRPRVVGLGLFYGAVTFGYFLAVAWGGPSMLGWLYDGAYAEVYGLAPAVAGIPIAVGGIMVVALAHRAAARTDRAFRAWLPYGLSSLPLGGLGAVWFGAAGLVGGIAAASLLGLASSGLGLRRSRPRAWEAS